MSNVLNRYDREDLKVSEKIYLLISATIFTIVALLHFVRLFTHWSFQIGAIIVPVWMSWFGLLVAATLSIWAFSLLREWKIAHQ